MIKIETQHIAFESKPENISLVERFIEEICDYFNVNNDYFGNILVAINESVNNAIVHGNKCDVSKKVSIDFKVSNGCLSFLVKDEGDGFDLNSIPDPTDPSVSDSSKGRGIYLIRHLADEVNFLEDGRMVEMNFKVSNINNSVAQHRIDQFIKHQSEVKADQKKEVK